MNIWWMLVHYVILCIHIVKIFHVIICASPYFLLHRHLFKLLLHWNLFKFHLFIIYSQIKVFLWFLKCLIQVLDLDRVASCYFWKCSSTFWDDMWLWTVSLRRCVTVNSISETMCDYGQYLRDDMWLWTVSLRRRLTVNSTV